MSTFIPDLRVREAEVHKLNPDAQLTIINFKGNIPDERIGSISAAINTIVPELKNKVVYLNAKGSFDVYQFIDEKKIKIGDESI